ncbi:hypothetical protein NY2A_b775R [Paramecium bursaria Chlorella virus NY2A]|uniref:Uncharacterized protein b775R n=1 Tax=Paramecium bursaria Chlorella virus NY2A TaxID=46021 RepID=A7IXV0_PBCVN|nr:hypothetical protein NY2A_b775R [Paramecium bursaria Chlorella virus NY2A]YP_001498783.1 hypothetical protein AR158_c702R [Paramecium bursaria Chlorella virus AR158]ABT15174.1 hypothetical protein NY2A_b775R [Paramecium bursaria Chlorella virus NY2A]ABU44247.1 hypothetical protein AR158_c702R [Paramecium bursaria Chlorella virus AR158]
MGRRQTETHRRHHKTFPKQHRHILRTVSGWRKRAIGRVEFGHPNQENQSKRLECISRTNVYRHSRQHRRAHIISERTEEYR